MAAEIQLSYVTGRTVYFLIRNRIGQIWNTSSLAFEAYSTATLSSYTVSGAESGTASGFYTGTFPASIVAGVYNVIAKNQAGGSAAEADATVGTETYQWNGSATAPLADTATSGQLGQAIPIRQARGIAISGFMFKLVSSADHITALTSGLCSGQISRDGGSFGTLQSGTLTAGYTEIGLGFYKVNLTSGDLLATTVALTFSAAGVSGGASDPRDFSMILQRTSGQ